MVHSIPKLIHLPLITNHYSYMRLVYQNQVTYGKSFADVRIGQPILYINSLYRVGLAINQGSFAKAYNVGVGSNWHIEIKKLGG